MLSSPSRYDRKEKLDFLEKGIWWSQYFTMMLLVWVLFMSGKNSCDKIIFHHCKDCKGSQKGHRSAPRICQKLHNKLQHAHGWPWCGKCAADTDPASQGRVLPWRPAIPTRLENLYHFTHASVPPLLTFLAVLPFISLCRRKHFCKKPFFQTVGSFPETCMLNTSHNSKHFIPSKGT